MPYFLRYLFLSLILIPVAASWGIADSSQQSSLFHFRTLGWNTTSTDLYYKNGGEYVVLPIVKRQLSGYMPYTGSPRMEVFSRSVDEGGRTVYRPVCMVVLPNHASNALIVFTQTQTGDWKSLALDDSIATFGDRDLLLANFSSCPLAFQVDHEDRFVLQPAGFGVIHEADARHAKIELAVFYGGQWQFVCRTNLRVRRGNRYLIFYKNTPVMDGAVGNTAPITPVLLPENLTVLENAKRAGGRVRVTGSLPEESVSYQ